ncbi:putative DNA-binding domain-containing protein [Ferrovum sp. PN-J185]|uniref:HvfC/BufC family peptide modification chaperone n=1 Tax=Ferrovum sp. PN-J185 TaxID=1356306 RepID=UPI000798D3E2|nr:putative DNA-binding domain-containing protein [Ferrovum sp. PN-J185]KXW56738.1 hypothetical protein FV185_06970 [Ferrovum sp. PN-J185]MCC6067577.1 putative DNA-binding domain-containing protein [Ferrovum sp. PN-J185]MDE1892063.1 putative DNA-binding domain-containing protein [Betaproteobacteria bacterium]MDE2056488.1 putative DNA-binding domain-containing protein [Betaproteobacteria bacterium]
MTELERQLYLFNEIVTDKYQINNHSGIGVYQRHFHQNFLNLLIQKYPILYWLIESHNFKTINYNYFFHYPTHSGNITTYGDQLDTYLKDISLKGFSSSFLIDLVKFEKELFYSSVISEFESNPFDLNVLFKHDPSYFTILFPKHLVVFQTEWPLIDVYNAYKSIARNKPVIVGTDQKQFIALYFLNTKNRFQLQVEHIDEDYVLFYQYLKNHSLLDALELMSHKFDFKQWLTYAINRNWIAGIQFINN